MAGNITFSMIKPDAVKAGATGNILKRINEAGFRIVAMKMTEMSMSTVTKFYEVHKGKPFFETLTNYMTSGPLVALVLQKDNAIEDFRKLIGATDPAKADEGTIRKLYGTDVAYNAIHGADSDENALREASFHFAYREMFDEDGCCWG